MSSYLMGIDLGTSSTKTLIIDTAGRMAGIGNADYGIRIPHISWAEQDPEEWWEAVKSSIGQAMEKAGASGSEIMGISFSGRCTAWWRWMKTKSRFARPLSIWTREAARTLPKSVPWQEI